MRFRRASWVIEASGNTNNYQKINSILTTSKKYLFFMKIIGVDIRHFNIVFFVGNRALGVGASDYTEYVQKL